MIVTNYTTAVLLSFLTMLCWGSWANTQKLTKTDTSLFYLDVILGMLLASILIGFSVGNIGSGHRLFVDDILQVKPSTIFSVMLGGVVFNIANFMLMKTIEKYGMAVAFPVAIGIAMLFGVLINYALQPTGNFIILLAGVIAALISVILSGMAKATHQPDPKLIKGLTLAVISGVLMSTFFGLVANGISSDVSVVTDGKLTSYGAFFFFVLGIAIAQLLYHMFRYNNKPDTNLNYYLKKTNHLPGIVGGFIWSVGMVSSLVASNAAGFAISYGLGQGATLVAALWGILVWREFKGATKKVNAMLAAMVIIYALGIALIIISKL